MRRVLVVLGLLASPALAGAAAPVRLYEVKQTLDRPYVPGAGARQKLDVFAPKGADGERFPVVILLHGGTWMFGDKDFYGTNRDAARNFARNGIVAVVPNYRLSPLVRHPEHAKDVAPPSPGPSRTSTATAATPTGSSSSATRPAATSPRCWPPTNAI